MSLDGPIDIFPGRGGCSLRVGNIYGADRTRRKRPERKAELHLPTLSYFLFVRACAPLPSMLQSCFRTQLPGLFSEA